MANVVEPIRSGMYSPPPAAQARVTSSKFLVRAKSSSELDVPRTDDVVAKYERPIPPFTYGRTGPDGTASCGPIVPNRMSLLVPRSTRMRQPADWLRQALVPSRPQLTNPPATRGPIAPPGSGRNRTWPRRPQPAS